MSHVLYIVYVYLIIIRHNDEKDSPYLFYGFSFSLPFSDCRCKHLAGEDSLATSDTKNDPTQSVSFVSVL